MGRNNGKLISFLKEALLMRKYINLTCISETQFSIELPRYERNMNPVYETILKDWYEVNGRLLKYENYCTAKSVFKAALNKSLYLTSLPKIGKKLQYQFSSSEQIEAKRNAPKRKCVENPPSVPSSGYLGSTLKGKSPESPSSVESSGYHSGSDDNDLGNWAESDENFQVNNNEMEELLPDGQVFPSLALPQNLPNISDEEISQILDDFSTGNFNLSTAGDNQSLPVTENQPAVQEIDSQPIVQASRGIKIWSCIQKIQIGSLMQLVCELVPGNENNEGIPETILTNGMFDAGMLEKYNFKKKLLVDKYLFLMFSSG